MIWLGKFAALSAALIASGCREDFSKAEVEELAGREQRLASRLALATGDSAAAPLARWVLPPQLLEISGLALTASGNLLAHNDENPVISVIDPRRGVVVRQFTFGERGLRADFEGIAVAGGEIFMLVSNGKIYRFREGVDGMRVPHTTIDTKLGKECEFEGIAVDAAGGMILACKNVGKGGPKDQMLIYRWDPRTARATLLAIPYADAIGNNGWKRISPSDITIEPSTKNYVVIAAQEKALIEVTPDGRVVRTGPLPDRPRQAEGVAIGNGIIYLSDEGSTRPATVSLYRWPLPTIEQTADSVTASNEAPQ
jgi:uncharacterized protein YjiK